MLVVELLFLCFSFAVKGFLFVQPITTLFGCFEALEGKE
jgi:hypothetical protein